MKEYGRNTTHCNGTTPVAPLRPVCVDGTSLAGVGGKGGREGGIPPFPTVSVVLQIIERLAIFLPFWPSRERSIKCISANGFADMDSAEILSSDSFPDLDFSDLEHFVDLLDFGFPSNEIITAGIEVKHLAEVYY